MVGKSLKRSEVFSIGVIDIHIPFFLQSFDNFIRKFTILTAGTFLASTLDTPATGHSATKLPTSLCFLGPCLKKRLKFVKPIHTFNLENNGLPIVLIH